MISSVLEYQIFVRLTIDIPILRCGYPCSHVLKITNVLMLHMIKVQHWKLYSSHYNDDDTGIGFELKKNQTEYQHYDGMGVPITWEILQQSRNQIITMTAHTYMKELLRRITDLLLQ